MIMEPSQVFAADFFYCAGGMTMPSGSTVSVELNITQSQPHFLASGRLDSEYGSFIYKVIQKESNYIYEIFGIEDQALYLQETVPDFASVRRVKTSKDIPLFVECKTYTQRDYCRYHTCL